MRQSLSVINNTGNMYENRFQGFTPATAEIFWDLIFNNDRQWFNANKERFTALVTKPFKLLAEDTFELYKRLRPDFQAFLHISRIYRDARRLYGRGPYKEALWFSVRDASLADESACFYFELRPSVCSYGMGFWCPSAAQAAAFRRSVDANPARFARLAQDVEDMEEFIVRGEEYKRPKGEHGRLINQWYNRKWATVEASLDMGGIAYTPELPAHLAAAFDKLTPIFEYLNAAARV